MRSGGGAFINGSAAEVRALEGRGQVGGLIGRADIGAGRNDLVDPVEELVGEGDVDAGEANAWSRSLSTDYATAPSLSGREPCG